MKCLYCSSTLNHKGKFCNPTCSKRFEIKQSNESWINKSEVSDKGKVGKQNNRVYVSFRGSNWDKK